MNHIGFNWNAYFRVCAVTKPMAVASMGAMTAFLAVGLPLLFAFGLKGFALGIAFQGLVHLAIRAYYLQRLFDGFGFMSHALRAFLPTLPATGVVLLLRAIEPGKRTLGMVLGELVLYALITLVATWYFESRLLREAVGYLTRKRSVAQAGA